MISIVMATYNGSKYLKEQLDSIMQQTQLPDEILISDDGSKDDTMMLLQEWLKEMRQSHPDIQIRIQQNEVNKGYIQNFTDTILKSKGDFVFLADQDDIWMENKIKDMVTLMQDKMAKVIHSDIDIVNEKKELVTHKWQNYTFHYRINEGKQFFKKLNYCGMSICFDGAYIRECLRKIKGIAIPTHDWAICACANIAGSFAQSGEVFTLRRYHADNVALKFQDGYRGEQNERLTLLHKYLDYYQTYKKMLDVLLPDDSRQKAIIDSLISLTEKRICIVEEHKVLSALGAIIHVGSYPSFRAYLGDLLYVMNMKSVIRKSSNRR